MKKIEELINQVQLLNDVKKFNEVIQILTNEILEKYDSDVLYVEKAHAYWRLSLYDKCKLHAEKALEININNGRAYSGLGNVYSAVKEYDKAIENFEKAIKLDNTQPYSYNGLGNVYSELQDYNKAIECFENAIKINKKVPSSYNGLGSVYKKLKQYDKAIENYKKYLEIDSDWAGIYYNLAVSYFLTEDYINAKINFKTYQKKEKIENDFHYKYATSRIEEINKIQANEDYEKIQEIVSRIKEVLEHKDNCITHFTSLSVAKLLVFELSKFRLSEGAYLNDTSEGRELFSFLKYKSPFGRKETPVDEVFVQKPFIGSFVSQSKHNDLTMWRMYGKEGKDEAKGCAITMNVKTLIEQIQEELGINNLEENEFETKFYKVAYWKDDKFIIPDEKLTSAKIKNLNNYCIELKNALDEFNLKEEEIKIQIDVEELLFEIAFLFKGIEYQYEHEVRLIQKGIGFEKIIDKSSTIPRVYIELGDISKTIEKITLGPKVERADEWASAFHYDLKNKDVEAEVHISRQPFK